MKKFKLKSGNTTSFKNMGSSPTKHTTESKHKNPHSTSEDFDRGGNLVVTDTETGRSATWKKGKTSKGTTKYTGPGGGSQFLSAKSSKKDRPEPTWPGTDEYRKPEDIPASEYEERGIKKYPIENPKKSPAKQMENPGKDAAFDKLMHTKEWMPGPPEPPPSKPKGIYTKAGDKKVRKVVKEGIRDAKELKKGNIKVLREAKKSGYKGAREDIRAERKKYRTTKKMIKSSYKQAKRKAKTTEPKMYTGPGTGSSA